MLGKHSKIVINTLKGDFTKNRHRPVWMMRQAGRYLPEYHKIRNSVDCFLNLCYNPKLATEITMQPITRFDFDASIVFSDILVIPDALGQKVDFIENVGPVLENITTSSELNKLIPDNFDNFYNKLNPVYETIDRLKSELPNTTTLIGFAGAPWTIASYMLASGNDDKLAISLKILKHDKKFTNRLFDILIRCISAHLIMQIKAGAEVIQIFDSWGGFLEGQDYIDYSIKPIKTIIDKVKAKYPDIPIIVFKRGNNSPQLDDKFIKLFETGTDCISVQDNINLNYIKDNLPQNKSIQGALASKNLLSGKNLQAEIIKILNDFKDVPHIFNLGEGINKQTPLKNVELLVKTIREYK